MPSAWACAGLFLRLPFYRISISAPPRCLDDKHIAGPDFRAGHEAGILTRAVGADHMVTAAGARNPA
jgi:hypothetical protein